MYTKCKSNMIFEQTTQSPRFSGTQDPSEGSQQFMGTHTTLFLFAVLSFASVCACRSVLTPFGLINGQFDEATNVSSFLGVPFVAAQPVGALRFSLMKLPPKLSSTVIDARSFPPPCFQYDFLHWPLQVPVNASEACLFLNVFVPSNASCLSNASCPVLVFIHGGGYSWGQSSEYPAWDLAATTGAIVVTVQYRLNIFGFLSLPSAGVQTNLGLLDQQVALQWIQVAISAFGGKSDQVVLFGQSAGGSSVSLHLMMQNSWPLFQAAILESPAPGYLWDMQRLEDYTLFIAPALANCSASTEPAQLLICLLELDATHLLSLSSSISAAPCIDGTLLVQQPLLAWQQMHRIAPNKTVIIGSTSNEGYFVLWTFDGLQTLFSMQVFWEILTAVVMTSPITTLSPAQRTNATLLLELATTVAGWYGVSPSEPSNRSAEEWFEITGRILGDYFLGCYACGLASAGASSIPSRLYRYWFTHNVTWFAPWPNTHACELGYVFNSEQVFGTKFLDRDEIDLASLMGKAWTSLANSSQPLLGGSTKWPLFDDGRDNKSVLILDTPPSVSSSASPCPAAEICAQWWNLMALD